MFKTKQDGVLCAVTIDGRNCSRAVYHRNNGSACGWRKTVTATNGTWLPRCLPIYCKRDSRRRNTPGEKQEKETEIRQGRKAVSRQNGEERTVESVSPQREAWDKIKAKHPDAIQFVRTGDNYTAYNEDAVKVTETLALKMEKHEADMKKALRLP